MCDDPHIHATVLVVDDHPAFRASARRMLQLDGFHVLGEAGDAATALRLARELEPQLVLLDVGLPDRSGLEVVRELALRGARVVLISSRGPSELGARVDESGAVGFVTKEELSGEVLLALLGDAP